jgi:cytochrome P450
VSTQSDGFIITIVQSQYYHSVAGAETTSGVMAWWMLAMTAYPDVQKRAQAELDNVVGRHRVPSFADFEHLPYIRAMVKEALRWRTIGPASLPHCLTQDDWYEGKPACLSRPKASAHLW